MFEASDRSTEPEQTLLDQEPLDQEPLPVGDAERIAIAGARVLKYALSPRLEGRDTNAT
jgi:hypothetical protein